VKRLALALALALVAGQQARSGARESVAAVLIAEAGGEGLAGMQAVANVIANRAGARGLSRLAVVSSPRQFSCLNGSSLSRLEAAARKHPRWGCAVALASQASLPDITGGANHYHAAGVSPRWAKPANRTARIGGHTFYKL
jgi:N-acetylmuramoyl-L-alanine amidase